MELTAKTSKKINIPKTEGYWIYDETGKKYLDITCGGFAFTLGYGNKEISQAIYNALTTTTRVHSPLGQTTDIIEEMSDFLCKSGEWSGHIWSVTGTGAIEAAIAISDAYWKVTTGKNKTKIIAFGKGWHGTSMITKPMSGMFTTTDERTVLFDTPIWTNDTEQRIEEAKLKTKLVKYFEENKINEVGSIVINPNPWFNGVNVWSKDFLTFLNQIKKQYEFLIISDDIASCWGKAKAFHSNTTIFPAGIKPDISCLGKAMTAGYAPISAVVVNRKIKDAIQGKVHYGHTYQPYMGGIAAFKATTDIILRDDLLKKSEIIESKLIELGNKLLKASLIKSFRVFGINAAYDIEKEVNDNLNVLGVKDRYYGLSATLGMLPTLKVTAPLIADEEYFQHLEELLLSMLK